MLGYGQTDAPESHEEYSLKKISDDLATLATHVVGEGGKIVLGGHDWGGAVVWKMTLWKPELVRGVFSVCTPYDAPRGEYVPLEGVVERVKSFKYQLQLAGREVEEEVVGEKKLRGFLRGMCEYFLFGVDRVGGVELTLIQMAGGGRMERLRLRRSRVCFLRTWIVLGRVRC
jgi:soluble epoxide hydrolase / lipid-phosphate phosphatase